MTTTTCPTCHNEPDTPSHELGCRVGRAEHGRSTPADDLHQLIFGDLTDVPAAITADWIRRTLEIPGPLAQAVLEGRVNRGRLEVLAESHALASEDYSARTAWSDAPAPVRSAGRRRALQDCGAVELLVDNPQPARPATDGRRLDHSDQLVELNADSVIVDAGGRCLIVGERSYAGLDQPERILRTTNYRLVNLTDVPFPVVVVYETEDPRSCWRTTDSLQTVLSRHAEWSLRTFGPGGRLKGLLAHIRKEIAEIEANPDDPTEWIDLAILALDGAFRSRIREGGPMMSATELAARILAKYLRNHRRQWPDWRQSSDDEPIEHIRRVS